MDSPPSRPKRLVPVYLTSMKRSKCLRLDQLLQDRLPAFGGEPHLLVGAFDALLNPGALFGIGDVHVFGADMLAIGALQDVEDLPQRAEFEAERAAEIDRPVVVGLGEAVGLGPELRMLLARAQFERVELGDEVATRAVVADEHARAQGILAAASACSSVKAAGAVASSSAAPFPGCQDGPRASAMIVLAAVLQAGEEGLPFRADRSRVLDVTGVELCQISGVGAVEKRRAGKHVVQFVPGHTINLAGCFLVPACRAKEAVLGRPALTPM